LEEKGGQQAMEIPLGGILEVEIVISNQGRRLLFCVLDVLDNGRAYQQYELPIYDTEKRLHTKECFFQHRLQNRGGNK